MRCRTLIAALAFICPLAAATSAQPPAPAPKVEPAVGSTLENLQAAHADAVRNAAVMDRHAAKADAEGFTQVGSLFRAAKRSHEIHEAFLAEAIKKAGGSAKPADKAPIAESRTTKENLEAAIKSAKAAKDTTLIAYRKKAGEERNKDADTAFRYVRESLIEYSRYMEAALDTLPQTRNGKKDYYVSRVCGYMVEKLDIKKCPVCNSDRDKFEKVN